MSTSGSLSGVSFSGLSSGIDTDSIISKLLQIEAIPIQRLQTQQQDIQSKQGIYAQLRTSLQAVNTAASALNSASAFNPVAATSSDTTVATITATNDAISGTYNLSVSKLAQAQKVSSTAQANSTSPLNKSGQFVINGKTITVSTTDSLRQIALNINSSNSGVTASIIDGGAGSTYLTFSSNTTGAANKIQMADLSGDSILGSLGVTTGASTLRETITNGATSLAFANNTDTVATLIGAKNVGAASFTINGTAVNVDLSTDTLQNVADKINAAGTGATATVRTVTDSSGNSTYKLDIAGTSGTPTFSDVSGNALAALGVTQQGYGNELVKAQDAAYSLDGVNLTSSTNTITTTIPNATLTLLKADSTTPPTSTLTLSKDTSAIKAKISAFQDAYNGVVDFISQNSQFDKDTFTSGPLFGDNTADQVQQTLSSMIFNNVPGLTGSYQNLASIGFNFDSSGKLTTDDSILSNAIASSPDAVANLFKTSGVGSTNDLQFVSTSSKTVASGAAGYQVNITALASKGSYTGETAQTTANPTSEILTFGGALFGSTPYTLTLNEGNNLSDTVTRINNDAKLKDLVVASIDGSGKLNIQSKKYGTTGNFSVTSNLAADTDNTGIGTTSAGTTVAGTDIMGTINGETATGNGQFLLGNANNATTDGLQILYTGTTTGSIGTITVRKGVGTQVSDLMNTFLDSVNGILTAGDNSLTDQMNDLTQQITDLQTALTQKQTDLKTKFANMETTISNLQAQGQRLTALAK